MERIAVVGTGLMGSGIIHVFAQHGFKVDIYGNSQNYEEKLLDYFDNEVNKGRLKESEKEAIIDKLEFYYISSDLENIQKADFVIETIKEVKELKLELFKQIDQYMRDDMILVSNSSTFSITELASVTSRPHRILGMHFISPVPMIDIVEIIKGLCTSEEIIEVTRQLCIKINKQHILVDDHPGFVFNRIFLMWINEAVFVQMENLTKKPEDIDEIMKLGMNIKVGPLKLIDLVGLDTIYYSLKSLFENLHDQKYRPCPLFKKMLDANHLGRKTGKGFYNYC
ncbi:MAG: 3-hydroxybutyryl-CoA dehydrogenase [Halanaerobiales bacterium]|nr:3-hydroxybutyryl-CoA dehydrogenase [Halanaerobiales bacterium]